MRKSFLTEWFKTFFTHAIVTLLGVIVLKVLAHTLPEKDFGVYLIIRRAIMLLMPVVTLNLSLSLARFISLDKNNGKLYYLESIRTVTIIALFILIISLIFKSEISLILFNSNNYESLIVPTIIFTYVTSIHWLATGYYRGNQNFNIMNILLIFYWIISTLGLSILIWIQADYVMFLALYFYICSGILLITNLYLVKSSSVLFLSYEKIKSIVFTLKISPDFKKVMNYGLKRLPQGFLLSILFFLPLLATSNFLTLEEAAYMGIVISIVRIMQIVVEPFNQLFVPKFSSLVQIKNLNIIKYYSQVVFDFFFTLPLLTGVFVYVFSSEIIIIWFGTKYSIVSLYLIIVTPSIGFYLIYVLIRGILDGLYDFPYTNIITLLSSLTTFGGIVVSYFYSKNLIAFTISLSLGLMVLGLGSLFTLCKKQKLKIFSLNSVINLVWLIIVMIAIYSVKNLVELESIKYTIFIKTGIGFIILIFSFYLYYRLKMDWLKEINSRIFSQRD